MLVSVLVLTRNEQQDLPGCLETLHWCDDIHVFDSMSEDQTTEIARQAGAHITERPFDNWASHQNWGLANIKFKHEWVFYIDADERMTPALIDSIRAAVASPGAAVAFRVQRRDFLYGTWLKRVQVSAFYMRLFRPERMRYERLVNPVSIPDGDVGEISGFLDHFPFSKGLDHWIDRHNRYSRLEAEQLLSNKRQSRPLSVLKALTESDFNARRFHQKELFYRLPWRPAIKFVYLYLLRRGFLDGRAGFTYAMLQSIYEYLIILKTREIAASEKIDKEPIA